MTGLRDLRRRSAAKDRTDAEAALTLLRPRQRLDAGLAVTVLALAGVTGAAGLAIAGYVAASGVFDPPVLQVVEDPRILTDYRDNPSPAVDAIQSGDALLIGRQDGSIDVFDLSGRTFSTESLPRDDALSGDLALLSSDCATQPCPPDAEVFAVTTEGGLAGRSGGDWSVILADMAFVGASGAPVEQADVRGWAVNDDGTRALVDAGPQGLGLFDIRRGTWQVGAPLADATQGPIYSAGAFWFASPTGIYRIEPVGAALRRARLPVPGTEGEILSLAPTPDDGLIAVRRGTCANGAGECLSVLRIAASGSVSQLVTETEANPDLNSAGLSHVALQGNDLLVIGTAGVHRYDASARHWTAIAHVAPTAHFATENGERIHAALPDRVLTIAGGEVVSDITTESPLQQVIPGNGDDLFGLDRDGRIVALSGAAATIVAPVDSGAPPGATFEAALALGDRFVAIGPMGVLVHDIRQRRYAFVPAAAIVPPLPLDDVIAVGSTGDSFWLVRRATGETSVVRIEGDFPAITLSSEVQGGPGTAIVQARLNRGTLDLVAASGAVYRMRAGGPSTLAGPALPAALTPTSMAATDDALLFSNGTDIWFYDAVTRAWGGPDNAPGPFPLIDIGVAGGRLVVLDGHGNAFERDDKGWQPVSGGPVDAAFASSQVQDALAAAGRLYLASGNAVQTYLPGSRSFGEIWRADGQNAEILSVAPDGTPVWTNDNGLYRGEDVIAAGPRFIDGWLGAAGPVAMLEAGRRYLVQGGTCLFLGAEPPSGPPLDVVRIDPDRILVRTAQGAGIFEPGLHRWLPVGPLQMQPDSRLTVLGRHLVRLDRGGVASLPLEAIARPGPCESPQIDIPWQTEAVGVQAALVDGAPEVLVLGAEGGLRRWRDGQITVVAFAPGAGPDTDGLLGAYGSDDVIALLGTDAIWSYDLARRVWSRQMFHGAPPAIRHIDTVWGNLGPMVSIWDANGQLWAGRTATDAANIIFSRVALPVVPAMPIPPDEILDMATIPSGHVVLGQRRLMLFARETAAAQLDLALPAAPAGWHLSTDASGALVLTDGAPDAPQAIYRIDTDLRGSHDLSSVALRYEPGDDRAYAFLTGDAGDARLLRVDRSLQTLFCNLPSAGEPECDIAAPAPMQLTREDMRAFDLGTRVLLTADALWRLDAASRPLARLGGPAVDAGGVLLRNGDALMFWEGPGRALWRIGREGDPVLVVEQADALLEMEGPLAVQSGLDVMGLSDGELRDPEGPAAIRGETILRRHFTRDGEVYLTATGTAIRQDGKVRADPLLAFDPDARAVLPVPGVVAGVGRAWLQATADGRLEMLSVGKCEVPTDPPQSLPVDFIGPPLPEPPAVFRPCMAVTSLGESLSRGEQIMDVEQRGGGALLIRTGTREILVDPEGGAASTPVPTLAMAGRLLTDVPTGGFRLVDGVSYINPPVIEGDSLQGLDRSVTLRILRPDPLPAYDAGWLAWDRDAAGFRIEDVDGRRVLPAGDAIRDGRFIAVHPGQGAVLADGTIAWLNPFGLWHQDGNTMRRVAVPPVAAAEALYSGVFLAADGGVAAADGDARPGLGSVDIAAGPITMTVDPLAQSVAATIPVAGQSVNAFDSQGFLHDRRQSVAQTGDRVVYLTPLGLVPANTLAGIEPRPSGAVLRIEAEGGSLFAGTDRDWTRQDAGQWLPSGPPFQNAALAQEGGRVWERVNGAVIVRPEVPAEGWRTDGTDLDFDSERLVSFAATPDLAVALTGAGAHPVRDLSDLRGDLAAPLPSPSAPEIDSRAVAPGRWILFARGTGQDEVWDASAGGWRQPAADERPWDRRHAADLEGMAVDFTPAPAFSIEVEDIGAALIRQPFVWQAAEAMPFDHVTAMQADPLDGALLIGTRMGLRRVTPQGSGFAATRPQVPAGASLAADMAVNAIGRPAASPDRVQVVFSGGACAESPAIPDPMAPCSQAPQLDSRLVIQTPVWRWTEGPAGVEGVYLLDQAQQASIAQPLQGFLPHDILADRLTCAGVTAELWRSADVLRIGNRQFAVPGAEQLHCQNIGAALDGDVVLDAGLYVVAAGTVGRFDGGALVATSPEVAQAVADRAGGRIVLDAGRMRYGLEGGAPLAQILNLARLWQDTPWTNGRLALDQPRWIGWRGGLQAVTGQGVIDIPGGTLDPDHVVVMQGPDPGAIAACDVVRVEALDGRQHGLAAETGLPLRLYCRDGTWLEGVTDGSRDIGAFAPVEPRADQRRLIDVPGTWTATQEVAADGSPAGLSIAFRDEPAQLTAGRFDFDTWRAVEAPFAGVAEYLTDSGWWRAPAEQPDLAATRRPDLPVDARQVAAITSDALDEDESPRLCIVNGAGERQLWDGQGGLTTVGECRHTHGADALWQWWQTESGPAATATALNGVGLSRQLVNGRFSDLIVQGSPLRNEAGLLLVPAGDGVLVLSEAGGTVLGIYASEAGGVLTRESQGRVALVQDGGALLLAGESRPLDTQSLACPGLSVLATALADGLQVLRIQPWIADTAMVRLRDGAQGVDALLSCRSGQASRWTVVQDVTGHPRNLALGAGGFDLLMISAEDEGLALRSTDLRAIIDSRLPSSPVALVPRSDGQEALLVDPESLWSVSLASAIGTLRGEGEVIADRTGTDATTGSGDPAAGTGPAPAAPAPEAAVQDGSDPPLAAPSPGGPDTEAPRAAPSPPAPPAPALQPDPVAHAAPSAPALPSSAATQGDEPAFDVAAVQKALVAATGLNLQVDGVAGPRTRAAISAWQTSIGSEPTGFLSAEQLAVLLAPGGVMPE